MLINNIIMINFKNRDIMKKYLEIVINILIFSYQLIYKPLLKIQICRVDHPFQGRMGMQEEGRQMIFLRGK